MGIFFGKYFQNNYDQTESSQMEEVLLRFGHIGDQIFEELDSRTLKKCGFVGRDWKLFLDQGKYDHAESSRQSPILMKII